MVVLSAMRRQKLYTYSFKELVFCVGRMVNVGKQLYKKKKKTFVDDLLMWYWLYFVRSVRVMVSNDIVVVVVVVMVVKEMSFEFCTFIL